MTDMFGKTESRLYEEQAAPFAGCTKEEDIQYAKDHRLNIAGTVMALMLDDSENETGRLVSMYDIATPEECALMDAVLVCLCGETFSSLVSEADEKELYLDEEEDM